MLLLFLLLLLLIVLLLLPLLDSFVDAVSSPSSSLVVGSVLHALVLFMGLAATSAYDATPGRGERSAGDWPCEGRSK